MHGAPLRFLLEKKGGALGPAALRDINMEWLQCALMRKAAQQKG